MDGYLPQVYQRFGDEYPDVLQAFDALADRLQAAGPLSPREQRLAKLGIAVGAQSEGSVRSHTRRALAEGIEPASIRQVAVLAVTTAGYPAAIAAFGWMNEVLDRETSTAT